MIAPDTIFALSSAPGRAGIAVIRISGSAAGACLINLTQQPLPQPRLASLRALKQPITGELIDQALVIWFAEPHSFTGEDVVELYVHGGQAVIAATLEALARQAGCRLAEPGEFTRRAFDHDKLDLTAAEAIADLIDATTEAQRVQAVRQLEGSLKDLYQGWADQLIRTLAHLEAYLDFPDEPLPPELAAAHEATTGALITEIGHHLQQGRRGQRLRDGIRVVIVGAPNAGKSSLLNALTMRETAIVSPIAGTTRDVIESAIDIGGYPVLLSDTAGLRDSQDPIEIEGVRRATSLADNADLLILLYDASQPFPIYLEPYLQQPHTLLVANKTDLVNKVSPVYDYQPITISTKPNQLEISAIEKVLQAWLESNFGATEMPVLTRLRHQQNLELTRQALQRSQTASSLDLIAEDIRMAVRYIGQITGKIGVEDMLDIIFRDFCIGK